MNTTGKPDEAGALLPGPDRHSTTPAAAHNSSAGRRRRSASRAALMEAAADYHAEQHGYVPGCEMDRWLNTRSDGGQSS